MNILIVGGNSLLGRNLVKILSKEHKVYATVRDKRDLKFELNNNIIVVEIDLSQIKLSELPKKIDAIYYIAQSNKFREFPSGVDDMLAVNVVAPNILAKWAVDKGVKKYIYASSGGVYTNPDKPLKEFFDINANKKLGFYLNSKLSAEMLLRNFASFFETFVIIRPFFMYGKGQNESMLIPRLINNIKKGNKIILNGKKGIKINPIYITDAAKAVAKILDIEGEHIINIAGKEIVTLKELCVIIGKELDKEPIFETNNVPQDDLIADISMMKQKLSVPLIDILTGIKFCK